MKITIIILSAVALALGGLCVFFWRKWKVAISEKEVFKTLHKNLFIESGEELVKIHQELHKSWFVLAEKQTKGGRGRTMIVFIKGVEIPKNCDYCNADLACAVKCIMTQRLVLPSEYDTSKRHPACPLGELPPHGDLIDRSELLENSKVNGMYPHWIDTMDIKRMPVIVPAERSADQ